MKKLISILAIIVLILTFSACNKNLPNNEQNSEQGSQQNNQQNNQQIEKLIVNHNTQNKAIYTEYELGGYNGSALKDSFGVVVVGIAEYEIIQDYEEAKRITDNGVMLDKAIFEDNYILVVKCLYSHDTAGLIGFKSLKRENNQPTITIVHNGNGIIDDNSLYYLSAPKKELEDWADTGSLHIKKETANYRKTTQISVDKDFRQLDALTDLMSREEILEYIEERALPIKKEALEIAPSYLVCFSKNNFDNTLSFSYPIVDGSTITISRDYNLSENREERAFLNIIPLDVENVDEIKTINLNSYVLEKGTLELEDYTINKTAVTYDSVNFYKTFRGGVYYGTELAEIQHSSYTIIETHRELLDKTEFYIDEEIFKDNYVLVLKLVGVNSNRLGFADAHAGLIDVMEGSKSSYLEIDLYLSPFYKNILNADSESLKDEIYDEIDPIYRNKVEYEYIVVPRTQLKNMRKTGDLNIYTNTTFKDSYEPHVIRKEINNTNYTIVSGDTWRITTKLEMQDFNKKFGTSFSTQYIGNNYGREYIIVYLEDTYNYKLFQAATRETDTLFYLSYLVGEKEELTKKSGYFLCIEKGSSSEEKQVIIERTVISYGSYPSYSVEKEIKSYDHYEMVISYSKTPDFKNLVLTDYTQFEEIFNEYKYREAEEITADKIFAPPTFENNYVVVFQGYYNGINTYYNARIGGNNVLYLYAFEDDRFFDALEYQMLTFVSIPKKEISTKIKGVKIEYTKEPVFNGPFENVIISSTNQSDVKLEQKYVVINSEAELETILANYKDYEKLQSVDFENYFVLAFNNRGYATNVGYLYGDFVNFKTSVEGTAYITFMQENQKWINTGSLNYILDLVIIPREYFKHEISYLYVHYATYSEPFEYDELDRLEYPDILE